MKEYVEGLEQEFSAIERLFCWGTCRRIRMFCRSSGTRSRVTPIGGSKRSWRKPSTTFALSGATRRLFLSSTSGWVTHARACAGP